MCSDYFNASFESPAVKERKKKKTSAYFTLVRPNLEYCSSVCSPYINQAKNKIELAKRRAARYATKRHRNTCSVTDMLTNIKLETLGSKRAKSQMTTNFKIMHGLVNITASEYVTLASTRMLSRCDKIHSLRTRYSTASQVPFHYRIVQLL